VLNCLDVQGTEAYPAKPDYIEGLSGTRMDKKNGEVGNYSYKTRKHCGYRLLLRYEKKSP